MNYVSHLKNLNKPPLLPEDGATFHGSVESIPDDQFQASCWAQLDCGSNVKMEAPQYTIHNTEHEAKNWIINQAINRSFKGWYNESDVSDL